MSEAYQVGSYEAKTNFSQILSQVESGKKYVITRNGRPIAEIRPIEEVTPSQRIAAVAMLREQIAKQFGTGSILQKGETWRELLHQEHD